MFVLCPCLFRELHSAQHIKILSLISNLRLQLAGLVLVVHVESQDSSILTSTAMKVHHILTIMIVIISLSVLHVC